MSAVADAVRRAFGNTADVPPPDAWWFIDPAVRPPLREDRHPPTQEGAQSGCGRDVPVPVRICTGDQAAAIGWWAVRDEPPRDQQCSACGQVASATARFCPACGQPLVSPSESREERKVVTFLFVDLVDSTSLADKVDPEILRDVLLRYYRDVSRVIEAYRGSVEKFIGDAVLGVFGLPRVGEDDALRAVRAALDVEGALQDLNADLRSQYNLEIAVRMGISTGEIVVGDHASARSLVAADMLNVAARLQAVAPRNGILIADPTAQLIRNDIALEPVGPLALKGKAKPVRAWRPQRGQSAAASRTRSVFVGRTAELAALNQAFQDSLKNGAPVLMTVIGPPGAGKSRLVAEYLERVGSTATTYTGRCVPYGEGVSFWALREVVTAAAGLSESDDSTTVEKKIRALFEDEANATLLATTITDAIGVGGGTVDSQQIFWAVRHLFDALARARPVVVVWEDIHWAESSLLRLIRYVIRNSNGPILFVALARPEFLETSPRWKSEDSVRRVMHVPPLGELDVDRLIDETLGQRTLQGRTRRRIVEVADGNPLYIQEIVRMIAEGPGNDLDGDFPVPPTVAAVIAARLDRLSSDDKLVVQRAAVIGKDFDAEAVAHLVSGPERRRLAERLRRLEKRGLVARRPDDGSGSGSYTFTHILVQEGAYQTIPKGLRASLHAEHAEWLEDRHRDHPEGYEEIMGYHFERAFTYKTELREPEESTATLARRAAHHLSSAGRRAVARGDMSAAAKLLWRAQSMMTDPIERAEVLLEMLFPLRQVGRGDDARALLRDVSRIAASTGDERIDARARLIEQFWGERNESWATEARVQIQRAATVLRDANDNLGAAIASLLATDVDRYEGRYGDAVDSADRALRYARRVGDTRTAEAALRRIVWGSVFGPANVDLALLRCQEIVTTTELPGLKANTLLAMGVLHSMAGRTTQAHDLAASGRLMLEDLGAALAVAHIPILFGHIHVFAGDIDEAQIAFRSALSALEAWGPQEAAAEIAWAAACLARILYEQGRLEEAASAVATSERAVSSSHLNVRADREGIAAKLLMRSGDVDAAEARARAAVALARQGDDLKAHGDVLVDLASILVARNRRTEAAEVLDQARAAYSEKGIVLLRDKARLPLLLVE